MTEEGIDERELLWLLRSKVRRMIIETVGDSGRIGAVALRDKLGISTGSLYHNLRQLKHLVTQDDRRNYVLTELGERVYKLLKTRGDISISDITGKRNRVVEALSQFFVPYWLIGPLAERVRMGAVVAALSLLMLTALLLNQKMDLVVLHVYRFEVFSIQEFLRYLGITFVTIYLYFGLMTALYDLLARSEETDVRGVLGFLKSVITFSGQWRQALVLISLGLLPMSIYPAAAEVRRA
jgi:DNA-binding HxlR family transcriptional regulator